MRDAPFVVSWRNRTPQGFFNIATIRLAMNSLVTYLKNVRAELAHVVWPRPRTAIIHVALIVLITIIVALIVTGLDYVFAQAVERISGIR